MNIKRAFLAAAAVLMVPGYAMAQTVNFDVTVLTTNTTDVTVHATLECNTGAQLVQEDDISYLGGGTNFIVQDLDYLDPDTECGVTFSNIPAGYTVAAVNSNGDTYPANDPPHCRWFGDDNLNPEGNNCSLLLAPAPLQFTINKVWDTPEGVDVSKDFLIGYTCVNVYEATNDPTLTPSATGIFGGSGDQTYTVNNLYPDPKGTTYCTASETSFDSAVEVDNGCAQKVAFTPDNITGECTITNTVFFEGIPTLSQYGLAILAVLMLGVGFVGFRRFV